MKWSNFKDYVFKYMFPYYYQANDTYIDSDGKGILERFIDICSEYFDDEILPDISGAQDILDIDTTSSLYLNYLWEFFGYIPYTYGVITNGESYTKEDLSTWVTNPNILSQMQTRSLLKYAISLYKIRCTPTFYEVLGRMYGVIFTVSTTEPTYDPYTHTQWTSTYEEGLYDDALTRYDGVQGDCWECSSLEVSIYIPYDVWRNGKDTSLEALIGILNKYIPVHTNPLTTDIVTVTWGPETNFLVQPNESCFYTADLKVFSVAEDS